MNIDTYHGLSPRDKLMADLLLEICRKISESNDLLQTIIAMDQE